MRKSLLIVVAAAGLGLGGCVSYPVYQPVPVARLTPAQSAALASRPVTQADRDRAAADNAQLQRDDQADIAAQSYSYAYPTYPAYPYYGYGGPYYGGLYPWYPGLSLSLGFGYRGGWGGYRGGYRGGYGGGFHGHR